MSSFLYGFVLVGTIVASRPHYGLESVLTIQKLKTLCIPLKGTEIKEQIRMYPNAGMRPTMTASYSYIGDDVKQSWITPKQTFKPG